MAIWKARIASGVRAYFKVARLGVLVPGLGAGLFAARVINPGDTAFVSLAVAESTQQAGVYFVDVPSGFLTTHGAGHYGLSVGIHKPAPNKVDDEVLYSLEVTTRDLDDLATPADVTAARDSVLNEIVDLLEDLRTGEANSGVR